jgi:plastocyanin
VQATLLLRDLDLSSTSPEEAGRGQDQGRSGDGGPPPAIHARQLIIPPPVRRLSPLLAVCAALLAACGDDGGGDGSATTVPAGKGVRVEGDEYRFSPKRVVVTGAKDRTPLRITLANKGSLAHNLKLRGGNRELGGTPTFQGGESRSGSVALPPGTYEMVCTVGNHAELGMVGKLEVRR